MNFAKNIFLLLVSPESGWKEIKKFKVPKDVLLSKVFYPLIGLNAITSFVSFFYTANTHLPFYIQKAVISCSTYFFGYLIAAYILCSTFPAISNEKDGTNKIHIFAIYNCTILLIIGIIENLLPASFSFLLILPLYVIYISWRGTDYLNIPQDETVKFVVIASLSLLLPTYLIDRFLSILIPSAI